MDRKNTKELMTMLGLTVPIEMVVKANAVRWYGHALRREQNNALRRALHFEVRGRVVSLVGFFGSGLSLSNILPCIRAELNGTLKLKERMLVFQPLAIIERGVVFRDKLKFSFFLV